MTKIIRSGFGLRLNEKQIVLWVWLSVIAQVKLARSYGRVYQRVIGNERCVTRISGTLMELCYQVSGIMLLGRKRAKQRMWNGLTILCVNGVRIWCVKPCRSVSVRIGMSCEFVGLWMCITRH
jgi:hypothetical protein